MDGKVIFKSAEEPNEKPEYHKCLAPFSLPGDFDFEWLCE